MRILLLVISVFAMLCGLAVLIGAKSAIHEIEAFILFLIASVLFSAFATVGALRSSSRPGERPPS